MADEAETKKMWKIRKTLMKLIHDRGYAVTQDELHQTLEQFKAQFGDKPSENRPSRLDLLILVAHNQDPSNQMFVFFPDDPVVGARIVKIFVNRMEEESIFNAIIVVRDHMTSTAKRSLHDLAPKYSIQEYEETELVNKITGFDKIPNHVVLTPEEKAEVLVTFKMQEHMLIRMSASDPVAKYFGLRRGQVVKILQPSSGGRRYVSYKMIR